MCVGFLRYILRAARRAGLFCRSFFVCVDFVWHMLRASCLGVQFRGDDISLLRARAVTNERVRNAFNSQFRITLYFLRNRVLRRRLVQAARTCSDQQLNTEHLLLTNREHTLYFSATQLLTIYPGRRIPAAFSVQSRTQDQQEKNPHTPHKEGNTPFLKWIYYTHSNGMAHELVARA